MREKHSFSIFGRDERLTCEAARPHLSALADGALSEQDGATLRLHVSSCTTCSREQAALAAADRVLQAHEDVAVPAATWAAVEDRLRGEGLIGDTGVQPALGRNARRVVPLLHPVPLAVLLAVLSTFGLVLGAITPTVAALGLGTGLVAGFLLTRRREHVSVAVIGIAVAAMNIVELAWFRGSVPLFAGAAVASTVATILWRRRAA